MYSIIMHPDQWQTLIEINKQLVRISDLLEGQPSTPIPLSVTLWNAAAIGVYLAASTRHVMENITTIPSFPKAIRIPGRRGRSQPRWKAAEVIRWVESFKAK